MRSIYLAALKKLRIFNFSVKDFKELQRVKSRYLKRVLGVRKNNKNTYVYQLAEEALFVEELLTQYNLQPTENFVKFITAYKLV
jgi:hypothetical protein